MSSALKIRIVAGPWDRLAPYQESIEEASYRKNLLRKTNRTFESWLARSTGSCRAAGLLGWQLLRRGDIERRCAREVVNALLNRLRIGL